MSVCLSRTTHSLGRIFIWMIVIACISSMVTYHIGLLLPWVQLNQSADQVQRQIRSSSILINDEIKKSLDSRNQHPHRKLSQASDHQSLQVSYILAKLKQIEARIQSISAYKKVLSSGLDKNQTNILKTAFSEHSYTIISSDEVTNINGNWSVVWTSVRNQNFDKLSYQKYNKIPGLQNVIEQPGYICYLHNVYSKITEAYNISCFDFLQEKKNITYSLQNKDGRLQNKFVINNGTYERNKGSIWQDKEGLLTKDNGIIQLYVYVTSMFPLRIYIYQGSDLDTMKIDMLHKYGEKFEIQWWKKLRQSIVVSLLTTENLVLKSENQQGYRCNRCTQLLYYDILFTENLQPIILKIRPVLQLFNSEVLRNIVALMVTNSTVSTDIAVALTESNSDILIGEKECKKGNVICLLDSDLLYLLENAQESQATAKFVKVYPSLLDDYTMVINKLQQIWMNNTALHDLDIKNNHNHIPEFHTTPDLHFLLHQMENYITTNADYSQADLIRSNLLKNQNFHRHLKSSDQKDYILLDDQIVDLCSREPEDAGLLSSITIQPSLTFIFNPYQYTYSMRVGYDTILLQIHAVTKGCHTEARFDEITGCVSQCNYTIGLGESTIRIHIVDTNKEKPVIINTYTLTIYRRYIGVLDSNKPKTVLQACILKQDCKLMYLPEKECGLQPSKTYGTWNHFIAAFTRKPYCTRYQDYLDAIWTVPCNSCDHRESCYWQQAKWQPSSCQHRQYSHAEIKKCFRGKRLLFIGDSTNRGIMHYILERVNKTLLDWDKTHDLKLYTNVNDRETTMSFAYYPQFWLPNNHRPGFDKAIYQLIKWTSPLKNNSDTVLIVGGVHWLGKQHINIIMNALKREGLTGIKLIMKGHGAGFHQHVDGLHFASLANQQKLVLQEREVGRYALYHGFHVVPTFNMTMARYKDFLQGKCACHFHKVSMTTDKYGQRRYNIKGEVNTVYSEIVINSICQQNPG